MGIADGAKKVASKAAEFSGTMASAVKWIATEPVKAVFGATSKAAKHKYTKYAAAGGVAVATGLGVAEAVGESSDAASAQAQETAALQETIQSNRQRVAAAMASVADSNAPANNVANLEAANKQQAQQATPARP